MPAPPRRRAPASLTMCIDERIDGSMHTGTRQRIDDKPTFPFAVGFLAIPLDGAASARPVVRAERRLAIR
jgi:hypothetical protein